MIVFVRRSLQNIVWERVDPGRADKELAMRRMGEVQTYDMHLRPKGSTLHFHDVTPLDKGLYRCLASSVDRLTGESQTVFQDTDFYPDVVWGRAKLPRRDWHDNNNTISVYYIIIIIVIIAWALQYTRIIWLPEINSVCKSNVCMYNCELLLLLLLFSSFSLWANFVFECECVLGE